MAVVPVVLFTAFGLRIANNISDSGLTVNSASEQLTAASQRLSAGAIDVITKPAIDVTRSLEGISQDLIRAVKTVARANLQAKRQASTAGSGFSGAGVTSLGQTTHQIFAIASSTGGTEALKEVLPLDQIAGELIRQFKRRAVA